MIGLEGYLRQFDIVHTSDTWFAFSHQVSTVKSRFDIKMAVTQWENVPFALERQGIIKHLKTHVRNTADIFIAVTEKAKKALILEGVKEERIRILPMGVNINKFKPMEKDEKLLKILGLSDEDFIILFVGRLIWRKGIYYLVEAFKMLVDDPKVNDRIKMLIVGTGPEKQNLIDISEKLGIHRKVCIAGGFKYKEMPRIHGLADIFILPSTKEMQEQFGMVLVEAMASGKPIVTTASGSIPEVVGNAAVMVEPNNSEDLYLALRKLILDDGLREDLSKVARKRAEEKFNAIKISFLLEKTLTSL
jgi:glycosyltransferase involved in cell wall biosynthesis